MSWEAQEAAIVAHMKANFSETNVNYRGAPQRFGAPDGEWLNFFILQGDSAITSLGGVGSTRYAYLGQVEAHIYTPEHGGTGRGAAIADAFAAVWRELSLGTTQFRQASAPPATDPVAGFMRRTVIIPFYRAEVQ